METCRKSESSEPARQFQKESEILCPPPPSRQYFYPCRNPLKAGDVYASVRAEKACWGETVGVKFSLACAHYYHSDRYPSLRDPSPRLSLYHRHFCQVDVWIKGLSLSVSRQRGGGGGGGKEARSDAPIDVSPTLVGMNVPSSLHPSLYTFLHLCYQPEFAFPLFLSSSLLTVSFYLSIWYRRLLAARKGSRARGKPAVKLKHDEGSRLRCEGERRGEGAKKKERRGRRRQSDTRRRRRR